MTQAQLDVYAAALPGARRYERSFMHRDTVTAVVATPGTDFLVTGSADGCVKFWKKVAGGVTFVKVFRAHGGGVAALAASHDGARLASARQSQVE